MNPFLNAVFALFRYPVREKADPLRISSMVGDVEASVASVFNEFRDSDFFIPTSFWLFLSDRFLTAGTGINDLLLEDGGKTSKEYVWPFRPWDNIRSRVSRVAPGQAMEAAIIPTKSGSATNQFQ